MTLNGNSVTPTSSFPYIGPGPIDYSQLNFVRTEQTEYYYGTGSAANQLIATVKQVYDPTTAMLEIGGIILAFFLVLGFGIMKIRKMGK